MRHFFIFISLLSALFGRAQDGLYVHPQLGMGGITQFDNKYYITIQAEVQFDYVKGNWNVVSGVGYMNANNANFAPAMQSIQHFIDFDKNFDPHIIVPLRIGYTVHTKCPKLAFVPQIGTACGFRSAIQHTNADVLPTVGLQTNNHPCVTGLCKVDMQYKINDRYSFTCGPELEYMLNTILTPGHPVERAMSFNAGVKYKLSHKKTHRKSLNSMHHAANNYNIPF